MHISQLPTEIYGSYKSSVCWHRNFIEILLKNISPLFQILNFISSFWGYFLGLSLQPDIHTKKVKQEYKCIFFCHNVIHILYSYSYILTWSYRHCLRHAVEGTAENNANNSKKSMTLKTAGKPAEEGKPEIAGLPANNSNGSQQQQGRSQQLERQQYLQQQGRQQHSSNSRNAI